MEIKSLFVKKAILIFIFVTAGFIQISAQSILEAIVKREGYILLAEKINIKDDFKTALENEDEIEIFDNDKETLNDFKNIISKYNFVKSDWNRNDVDDLFYLVNRNQILSKDSLKFYSAKNNISPEELKTLQKEVRKYNNKENEYFHFPISMSEIIYNTKKDLALVQINHGNNDRVICLYKKANDNWIYVGYLFETKKYY